MNADMAQALRAPFDPALISKLPKLTCRDCSDTQGKCCGKHSKSKCRECGAWISNSHTHLDYVGHAETTDRLLTVDPEWSWEPVAFGPDGLPLMDRNGGLWMRLTVGGVTRLGYGDAQGKNGPNAVKEAIGDGIRNAAMRFGVALDLWAKSDLAAQHADKETGEIAGEQDSCPPTSAAPAGQPPTSEAGAAEPTPKQQLWRFAQSVNMSAQKLGNEFGQWSGSNGQPLNKATDEQILDFLAILQADFSQDAE